MDWEVWIVAGLLLALAAAVGLALFSLLRTRRTLDTLETAVNDAVKEAEAAKPSGSAGEKREQFFNLKHELENVENRLDYYDDDIEMQYRQGELSLEDYRSQEHSLELLEDQLDRAEDTLEYTFGMDD